VLHSLHYRAVAVSEPRPGVPQFMVMGYLDGIPFQRYDNERHRTEPQTPWMAARVEPEYWDRETKIDETYLNRDIMELERLQGRISMGLIPPHPGLHMLQRVCGCDLLSDGSILGYERHGYNGQDFISFDLGSGRFVAAHGAAQFTKRRWESDGITVSVLKNYLEHTCVEVLNKYVGYGRETLERK
ncbi:HMR1 protein, partial [Grantiella picta]|nr:HMR1 protein [Grantiella picta]